jgi:hypothetical protein
MTTREVSHPLFDEILDLLASTPTPENIINYHPSEALQSRLSDLLDRNRNGILNADERAELDEFSRMNHLMIMLKIRARKRIASS